MNEKYIKYVKTMMSIETKRKCKMKRMNYKFTNSWMNMRDFSVSDFVHGTIRNDILTIGFK